jgi:hypothetical protein
LKKHGSKWAAGVSCKINGRHLVLKKTVAGSKGSKQRLLDIAAQADAAEGIRQGLEDVKKGRVQPAREFFDKFEAEYGLSLAGGVRNLKSLSFNS